MTARYGWKSGFPESEADFLLEFLGRGTGWGVLVCLVGTGQEIHVGEEAGLQLWNKALSGLSQFGEWRVHGPAALAQVTVGTTVAYSTEPSLSLDTEVRFHLVQDVARFVEGVLAVGPPTDLRSTADKLETAGYHLRIARDLDKAKSYLRDRYRADVRGRFGLLASSRDKTLTSFGVPNDQDVVRRVRRGPWFVDDEADFSGLSGRHLRTCLTEFQVQGLELDGVLLAWGTDLRLQQGQWNSDENRRYRRNSGVVSPHTLRVNSYRVLLTRAREVLTVFVPPLVALDETYSYLVAAGFQELA